MQVSEKDNKPIAEQVRTESNPEKPKLGTLRGRIKINDPNWWHPMSQDEVDAMLATPDGHEQQRGRSFCTDLRL